jgi:NTE family protein
MSAELQKSLDYESKLDRSASNIDRLIAEGEKCARAFLHDRAKIVSTASPRGGRAASS